MSQATPSPTVTAETLLSPGGAVQIGDRLLRIEKLTASGEVGLYKAFCDLHRRQRSPGALFSRVRADLEFLRKSGMNAEWEVLANRCAAQTLADDPGEEASEEARMSPAGVALELFARTRTAHPEVKQTELEAVITSVNALDVYRQIVEALTGRGKGQTPSS